MNTILDFEMRNNNRCCYALVEGLYRKGVKYCTEETMQIYS